MLFDLIKKIKYAIAIAVGFACASVLVGMVGGLHNVAWAEPIQNPPTVEYKAPQTNSDYDTTDYIQTGNGWFTPVCTHGEQMVICLPIVNMSPWNVKDVVICPVLSGKDEDWPFEITQANITIPVGTLLGSNAQPDINARTQNVFWPVVVREDVLNGYYRLDFQVLYIDDICLQGVSRISLYVNCIGKEGAGNKNSDEELETSTPRIIVTGFETVPETVSAGQDFELIVHLKNTSEKTAVNNVQIDLTATESGKDANQVYATFLPTKGSNTAYFATIPSGGYADIQMGFTAKSDLEQRPYSMKLAMKYENDKNKAFEGEGSISIPVKQQSRFEISNITTSPSSVNVGYDTNIMFSIYNTGKTTLYNVKADFIADSIGQSSAFVGNLSSGATGNIDCLVTGQTPTMDDGTVIVRISYEDESGNVTAEDFTTNILVTSLEPMGGLELIDMGDEDSGRIEIDNGKKFPKWLMITLIGVGVAIVIAVIIIVIIRLKNKKKTETEIEYFDEEDE